MKRFLPLLALFLAAPAFAQLTPIYCVTATSVMCNTSSNPGNHYQGDSAWLAFGKINAIGTQLGLFANQTANEVAATPSGATGILSVRALVGADIPPINLAGGDVNGGVAGVLPIADGGTGLSTVTANDCLAGNSAGTAIEYLPCAASGMVYPGAGVANSTGTGWGTSYSSSNPFPADFLPSALSSQTSINNSSVPASAGTVLSTGSTASMASGFAINYGAGTINANEANGATIPPSANCVGTNSSSQLTAGCPEPIGNGGAQITSLPYTVATTDCGSQLVVNDASAGALDIPVATGSFATCQFDVTNLGAGTATLTPTTSTINGATTLAVAQNRQCTVNSDGTNWQVIGCTALITTSGITVLTSGTQALGTAAIASGACATTIQVAVTGGTTSDTPNITYTTDPNTVTGYKASATGGLYANAFMTSGDLNIEICNSTAASITPAAMSVYYSVTSP